MRHSLAKGRERLWGAGRSTVGNLGSAHGALQVTEADDWYRSGWPRHYARARQIMPAAWFGSNLTTPPRFPWA